jgi:putative membrane protein
MQPLSEGERAAIEEAIARAEKKTSGEIVVMVTRASARYFAVGVMWAALIALIVPLILFTNWPVEQIYAVQLVVFAVALALILWDPLRFALVPQSVKRAQAHKKAVEEFLAQNLHTTKGHTGLLIYVSFAEHFAGLIADNAIDKKVSQETWEEVIRGLTDHLKRGEYERGLISSVEACGKLLAKHFPPGRQDADQLPNHLIVRDVR